MPFETPVIEQFAHENEDTDGHTNGLEVRVTVGAPFKAYSTLVVISTQDNDFTAGEFLTGLHPTTPVDLSGWTVVSHTEAAGRDDQLHVLTRRLLPGDPFIGATTVTADYNINSNRQTLYVIEISGVEGTLDGSAVDFDDGTTGNPLETGTYVGPTSSTDGIAIGVFRGAASDQGPYTTPGGSDFTFLSSLSNNNPHTNYSGGTNNHTLAVTTRIFSGGAVSNIKAELDSLGNATRQSLTTLFVLGAQSVQEADGTIPGTSALSGDAGLNLSMQGTVPAQSNLDTSSLTKVIFTRGNIIATSNLDSDLTTLWGAQGSVDAVANLTSPLALVSPIDVDTKGWLEAVTETIGESDNEIGGLRQTRVTAGLSAGSTSIPIESGLDWPVSGKVAVQGIAYNYASRTNTTLDDITHDVAGSTVAGTAKFHESDTPVLDISKERSALENVRRAMLVNFAEGEDLNALGRNLGVLRLPTIKNDDQFRDVIKSLAYNPKGTFYGIDLALTAMVGAGNYTISEDLIDFPNTVFITLSGAAVSEDISAGKAYMDAHEFAPAVSDTSITLSAEPLEIAGVRFKPEELETDAVLAKPSAEIIEEYPTDPGTQTWFFQGNNENTQVLLGGIGSQFDPNSFAVVYEHRTRIQPGSAAYMALDVLVPAAAPLTTDGRVAGFSLEDTGRTLWVGFQQSGGGTFDVGFIDSTGAWITGPGATLTRDVKYTIALQKIGNRIELLVDGTFVTSLLRGQFDAQSTVNKAEFGTFVAGVSGITMEVAAITLFVSTLTDYWASRGGAGVVANPNQLDTNLPGTFQSPGDFGKAIRILNSGVTNAQGGNNNGTYEMLAFTNDEEVTLIGPTQGGAQVLTAAPTRVTILNNPSAFQFPDDLGKSLEIENSTLGNNGTWTIIQLLEPGSLVDLSTFDTELPQKTNIAVLSGPSFTTENDLDWHLEPNFVAEGSLNWELDDTGSFSGTAVTLRQPLPLSGLGFTRIMEVLTSDVLTAQVLGESIVLNVVTQESPIVLYSYYPFYVADPLGFVRTYLDTVTAAGVIPEFKIV